MRLYFIFLLTLINGLAFSQSHKDEISNVEGFIYQSKSNYLRLFDKQNTKSRDSIQIPKDDMNRLLIIIDKIDKNWVKIKYIRYAPVAKTDSLSKYRGKWICDADLFFNVGVNDDSKTIVYENANKSKSIDIISGFQIVKIISVKKSWAKVEYSVGGHKKTGWIARQDQCSYFWTACNW